MTVSERIKIVRKEKKLTMEKFGQRIGITKASVSLLESGKNQPSERTLMMIASTFDISLTWLKTGEGPMGVEESTDDMINRLMAGSNEFAKSVMRAFARLDDHAWQALSQVVFALQKGQMPAFDVPSRNFAGSSPADSLLPVHIAGEAAAGQPLYDEAFPDEFADLPAKYADPDRYRIIRARGDSMEPKIHSGDIVVAEIDVEPFDGQMALVFLDGLADDEYVIKRVYRQNGQVVLRSYNSTYNDMVYDPSAIRSCELVVEVFPQAIKR